jgi:uncharacterized protein with ParB-like and HNH nuclease domain
MSDTRTIEGKGRTVRELLSGVKYAIDYYQREYKWQAKQIQELVDDLADRFMLDYEQGLPREKVAEFGHYFLGSIIVSKKEGMNYLVDGQQRLTSLTLLLIYLRNLQKERTEQERVDVDELIFSVKYGRKSFNLNVEERNACMEALFDQGNYDATDKPDSVQNIVQRYADIENCFPDELRAEALPYFVDWLLENVHLVEIVAYSDDDAYTIFETMNDRGLSLTPTDMLKGFLLANISDSTQRTRANTQWKDRLLQLTALGKEMDADFFKTWFRSQYANKIRERKKGAKPEEYDRMGTEFHRWFRDAVGNIGLNSSADYFRFIDQLFDFYSRQYIRLIQVARTCTPGWEHVYYNAQYDFTLQYMLLLAPLKPGDDDATIQRKVRLVAMYINTVLAWRSWNYRSIGHSSLQYAMFNRMKAIRGLDIPELARNLHGALLEERETFDTGANFRMHKMNSWQVHLLLARISDHVETACGNPSRFTEFAEYKGPNRYEVEHIWANKPERHTDEFDNPADFQEHRNRIGGLLLLPKSFNASYGALPYADKLAHYYSQNLLARSLNDQCYQHNPSFVQFVQRTGLPFRAHEQFKKADVEERSALYQAIAKQVWDPALVLREAGITEQQTAEA